MPVLKYYNPISEQWEPVIEGPPGPTGPTGPTGPIGPDTTGANAGDTLIFNGTSTEWASPSGIEDVFMHMGA